MYKCVVDPVMWACSVCSAAPEVLSGGPYNHAADWWSLGILLFSLVTGKVSSCCQQPQSVLHDKLAMLLTTTPPVTQLSMNVAVNRNLCKTHLMLVPSGNLRKLYFKFNYLNIKGSGGFSIVMSSVISFRFMKIIKLIIVFSHVPETLFSSLCLQNQTTAPCWGKWEGFPMRCPLASAPHSPC